MIDWYSDPHLNTGPEFKWWPEYPSKFSLVFKWHLNAWPFCYQTTFNHLNIRLLWYSAHGVQQIELKKSCSHLRNFHTFFLLFTPFSDFSQLFNTSETDFFDFFDFTPWKSRKNSWRDNCFMLNFEEIWGKTSLLFNFNSFRMRLHSLTVLELSPI